MTDAAENIDGMTLEECLRAMRWREWAPEDFVIGYREGYLKLPYDAKGAPPYRRGYMQGVEARWRGAHNAEWTQDGGAA